MLSKDWPLVRLGLQAKLFAPEALATMEQQLEADSIQTEAQVAQQLVKHGLVTRYQAKRLLRGIDKGYFLGPYKLMTPLKENEFCRYYGAVNVDSGEKSILCVLKADQPDQDLAEHFLDRVKARKLPEMPAGRPKSICKFGETQVAVLSPPPQSKAGDSGSSRRVKSGDSTAEVETLPTLDDLPVMSSPASYDSTSDPLPDISNLLTEPDPVEADRSSTSEPTLQQHNDLPEDEPIVDDTLVDGELAPVAGYGLKGPKKKAKARKSWKPSPRLIVGAVGALILVVLVLVLRNELSSL